MSQRIINGYNSYTTTEDIFKQAGRKNELTDVGTSITITVSWSWTVTWAFTF